MPTVIALDVSLSMCRPVGPISEVPEDEIPTRKTLAIEAVNQFLDHISGHCKLEFVSLLTFSTLYEVVSSFNRDLESVRSQLENVKFYDATNFETLLHGISTVVLDTWGTTVPVQILLITDGTGGFGPGCLKETIRTAKPFAFPAKMNILSISDSGEKNYTENCQMLQKLIDVSCGDGMVYFPENHLTSKGCSSALAKLCAKDFTPYKGMLKCGQLQSKVTLCPPPQPFVSRSDDKRYDFSDNIDILGFLKGADLGNPPAHSRHLILPLKQNDSSYVASKSDDGEEDVDSRTPNFCVLLHGALKLENSVALCEVGSDWFGFIYTWADNKKKSNLMLSILAPGTDVVPWMGNMHLLGPAQEFITKGSGTVPSFPVKSTEKKSYGSNPTVWITPGSINSDVQKLLRHARKLPEKNAQFFKELNRMRRWAMTIGFEEILESIALVLERECMVGSAHPEASIQLTHAASQLRSRMPYSKTIQPSKSMQ